jgi:hypothetical protein
MPSRFVGTQLDQAAAQELARTRSLGMHSDGQHDAALGFGVHTSLFRFAT